MIFEVRLCRIILKKGPATKSKITSKKTLRRQPKKHISNVFCPPSCFEQNSCQNTSQETLEDPPRTPWRALGKLKNRRENFLFSLPRSPSVFFWGPESAQALGPSDSGSLLGRSWPPRGFRSTNKTDFGLSGPHFCLFGMRFGATKWTPRPTFLEARCAQLLASFDEFSHEKRSPTHARTCKRTREGASKRARDRASKRTSKRANEQARHCASKRAHV